MFSFQSFSPPCMLLTWNSIVVAEYLRKKI
nr:MAG TPA: hypothetical protein [Bacteriophage sp.]